MKIFYIKKLFWGKGFSLLELLIYLSIISFLLTVVVSSVMWMNNYSLQARAEGEALENARTALDAIVYETRGAKKIYDPTTSVNQLSLETTHYLPDGEDTTYIDFFLCDSALCLKKESQNPIALTSDSVIVADLSFSQIQNNSIQASITINYSGSASVTLTSAVRVRGY